MADPDTALSLEGFDDSITDRHLSSGFAVDTQPRGYVEPDVATSGNECTNLDTPEPRSTNPGGAIIAAASQYAYPSPANTPSYGPRTLGTSFQFHYSTCGPMPHSCITCAVPMQNRPSNLIRDAPKPDLYDNSERAQIIRVAQSRTGRLTDFTWGRHYDILHQSVHDALISQLNDKLAAGLTPRSLLRELDITKIARASEPYVVFAQSGMQVTIDWMWCSEHFEIMAGLDLENTELGLEDLDGLVKATGAWMAKKKNRKAAEAVKELE